MRLALFTDKSGMFVHSSYVNKSELFVVSVGDEVMLGVRTRIICSDIFNR